MSFYRSVGAEPLLPWNRMIQNQNAAFQPNQYQMLGGPGGYPPRRDDHRGGRQVISTMWAVEGKQHTAHC
jgi:5'-3' exoribonuclease 2